MGRRKSSWECTYSYYQIENYLYLLRDYIEESIDLFGEEISTKVSSPEKKGSQNVDEIYTRLENKDAGILHSVVEKYYG